MAIRNLFKSKLDKEKKRVKYRYLVSPYLKKEYLKIVPEEKIRDEIYNLYFHNPELISNFFEIYKHIPNFAIMCLESGYYLSEESLEKCLENIEFVKKCLDNEIDLNNIFLLIKDDNVKKYFEIYGKEVLRLIKKYPSDYKEILNNELFQKLDINFIIENAAWLLKIMKVPLAGNNKKEIMLDILINNKKEFIENYELFKNSYYDLISFIKFCDFDNQLIEFINIVKEVRDCENLENVIDLYHTKPQNYELFLKIISSARNFINQNEMSLELYKKTIFVEYIFNINFNNVSKIIDKISDIEIKNTIEMLEKVSNAKSFQEINNILNKYNIKPNPLEFYKRLKDFQKKDLNDNIFSPKILQNIPINEEGIKIIDDSVIDLSHFSMLTHALISNKGTNLFNEELAQKLYENPEIWSDLNVVGSDLLCCSKITENDIRLWGTSGIRDTIFLGFSNLDKLEIHTILDSDANSNMEGKGEEYYSYPLEVTNGLASNLNNNILTKFDEIHTEVTFGRIVEGKKIKPTYILIFENYKRISSPLTEQAKKYAKFFDIPIVFIDGNKVKKTAYEELENLLSNLDKGYVTEELFYNIMLKYRTIENVTRKYENLFDNIIIKILDIVILNPTPENIFELQKIMLKYNNFHEFIQNDKISEDKQKQKEIINLRNQKINIKIAQINELLNKNNTVINELPSMGRGFISIIYILIVTVTSYILFLIYKFFT